MEEYNTRIDEEWRAGLDHLVGQAEPSAEVWERIQPQVAAGPSLSARPAPARPPRWRTATRMTTLLGLILLLFAFQSTIGPLLVDDGLPWRWTPTAPARLRVESLPVYVGTNDLLSKREIYRTERLAMVLESLSKPSLDPLLRARQRYEPEVLAPVVYPSLAHPGEDPLLTHLRGELVRASTPPYQELLHPANDPLLAHRRM
jgi:hypothetical protein